MPVILFLPACVTNCMVLIKLLKVLIERHVPGTQVPLQQILLHSPQALPIPQAASPALSNLNDYKTLSVLSFALLCMLAVRTGCSKDL